MLPSGGELQLSPGSTRSSLSPGYVWAYYFKHVLYINFIATSKLRVHVKTLTDVTWCQNVIGDSMSNTHCVSGDMYVSASTGNNDERQHVQCSEAHVCLKTCICLNWYPTVLFSYGRLLHDSGDSGAMVKRLYIFCVLNALNILPSQKVHKLCCCACQLVHDTTSVA